MKKFIMITPLQPAGVNEKGAYNYLCLNHYEAVGNSRLRYDKATRFPLIPVINGYAEAGEQIRVIAVTPQATQCQIHLQELREELAALQAEKGFLCDGVEEVSIPYAGDVASQIEIFHKLLPCFEDNDILFGCITYGNKPMPIAEMMAIQYAYRILNNVSMGCLVYGELDHSAKDPETGKSPARLFDITAMIQLDEIVRMLAERKVKDPMGVIERLLAL